MSYTFPMTIAERMAEFCEHQQVAPCKIRYSRTDGDAIMTDELLEWHTTNGASIDWICLGRASSMFAAYRESTLQMRENIAALRALADHEAKALTFVLRVVLDEGLELLPAVELWKAECAKRREDAASAA